MWEALLLVAAAWPLAPIFLKDNPGELCDSVLVVKIYPEVVKSKTIRNKTIIFSFLLSLLS